MGYNFITGFETGDSSEVPTLIGTTAVVTSPIVSGTYSGKATSAGSGAFAVFRYGNTLPSSNIYCIVARVRIHITTAPASQDKTGNAVLQFLTAAIASVGKVNVQVETDGSIGLYMANSTQDVSSSIAISADVWHLIQFKAFVDPTGGILEYYVDGALQASVINNTGSTNITGFDLVAHINGVGAAMDIYFDDVAVSSTGYPDSGKCIARQGFTGTPTYDSFTKNGAATAALCWSDTPFGTGTNCTSIVNGGAQTMLTASFSSPQDGHGTEIIDNSRTIFACKTAIIGKVAIATNHSIRRRLAGVDTDTSVAVTTADKYFDDGIWTDTLANLNSSEIGVLHGTNVNLLTIEDVWIMVYYLGDQPWAQILM